MDPITIIGILLGILGIGMSIGIAIWQNSRAKNGRMGEPRRSQPLKRNKNEIENNSRFQPERSIGLKPALFSQHFGQMINMKRINLNRSFLDSVSFFQKPRRSVNSIVAVLEAYGP